MAMTSTYSPCQTNHLIATRRDEMEGLRAQLQPLLATCAEKSKLRAREQELDVEHRHALTRRAEAKRKLGQVRHAARGSMQLC